MKNLMANELQILEQISHPNIVRIFELLEDDNNYYIVSELMKHGELQDFASKRNGSKEDNFSEDEVSIMTKEIFLALNFMHQQNLVHRDLKPQNILIENPKTLELKITDFGFATFYDQNDKL